MPRCVRRAMLVAGLGLAAACWAPAGAWAVGEFDLTLSGAPSRLIVGDVLTLTATVKNNDPLKTGTDGRVIFNPVIDPFQDAPNVQGPGCQLFISLICPMSGNLAPEASTQVQVTSSLPALGPYAIDVGANAELLGGVFSDPPLNSPTVRYETTVEPKADVKLAFSTPSETVPYGAGATFAALITNTTADGTAYGAKVKFSIPPGVQIASQPEGCTGTALSLTCPVGDLGPQLTAQRLVTLRSATEGTFTVLAAVTWDRPDTTPVDTQGSASVAFLPPAEPPAPPAPPPTPKPIVYKAKTVSLGRLAQGVPSSRRCIRKRSRNRKLRLVLKPVYGSDPVLVTIRATRSRTRVLKTWRARRPFTVRIPSRTRKLRKAVVRLTVQVDSGRRYKARRTYRLC